MKQKLISLTLSSFLILQALLFSFSNTNEIFAQENPTPTANATESTTQKLKERIEKIVEEKKQQVQGAINDLSYNKRGFIGEIQRLTQETITIRNEKGTQIIPLTEEIKLFKSGKAISTDDIAVEDWAVVLGIVESDEFVAKRIHIHSDSLLPSSRFVELATIEEISPRTITVKPRSKEEAIELTHDAKTRFQDNKGEKAVVRDFEENMQVLIIGAENESGKKALVIRYLASFDRD